MRRLPFLVPASLALLACAVEERPPVAAPRASCFGDRVLSYRDLVAEVVIPAGEECASGSFQVVFTRADDTLATLTEIRSGTVGFIGTADVDGDGNGEFFVATMATDNDARGALFAYTDGRNGINRFPVAALDSAQLSGYAGHDRFGFGGADELVRAFPRAGADSAWFSYSHHDARWVAIPRPAWVR